MKGALILLLVSVCCVCAQVNYRLPVTVRPINYNIEITPYFTAEAGKDVFTFDGIARIRLITSEANIAVIQLHALNVPGPTPTLVEALVPATQIAITNMADDPVTHKRTLNLASALRPNIEYILTFTYVGFLNEDMNGFYRSYYMENGQTKYGILSKRMLSTNIVQFLDGLEPLKCSLFTHARYSRALTSPASRLRLT